MRALFTSIESTGRYRVNGQRIDFYWDSMASSGSSGRQVGIYSLEKGKLVLQVSDGPVVAYTRRAAQRGAFLCLAGTVVLLNV